MGEALVKKLVNEELLEQIPKARRLLENGSGSRSEAERILGRLIAT